MRTLYLLLVLVPLSTSCAAGEDEFPCGEVESLGSVPGFTDAVALCLTDDTEPDFDLCVIGNTAAEDGKCVQCLLDRSKEVTTQQELAAGQIAFDLKGCASERQFFQ